MMALNIDFNALKAQTMGSGNDEEAVTVDTRGLISKVLARYSGKWYAMYTPMFTLCDSGDIANSLFIWTGLFCER